MYKSKAGNSFVRLALLICVLTLCFPSQASSAKADNLYLVKKIYVLARGVSPEGLAEEEQMKSYLKQELTGFGFVVVDDEAEADATLIGTLGVWITLDGPQPDPPKYSFKYELTSSNNQRVWHTDFNISSRSNKDKVNRKAAQKIAKKLFEAWRKSAKKAGLNIGEKVTG